MKLLFTDKNDSKIEAELENLKSNQILRTKKSSLFDNWKEFKKPELYKPFLIMILFFAIQQFSGIFVIFIYAAQFSLEAGIAMDEFLSAVIIGVIRCATTLLMAFVSDKFGRKPLVVASGIGMFISMLGLAICAKFPLSETNFKWLPALLVFTYIFSGTLGILTLPFSMIAEMYPQKTRGFAVGITSTVFFILIFIVVKTFSCIFEYFGSVIVFSFYAFVALMGIMFGIFVLPETKGKSLQEIEENFRNK